MSKIGRNKDEIDQEANFRQRQIEHFDRIEKNSNGIWLFTLIIAIATALTAILGFLK